MELAPVVLFAYNRPDLLEQTLGYLSKNVLIEDTVIYAFSDGPKNEQDVTKVNEVREVLKNINFAKKTDVVCREKNMGLANNIISGISEVFTKHDKVIVVEDDVMSSPNFLLYENDVLNYYEDNEKIFCVAGYSHPSKTKDSLKEDLFFLPRSASIGWGTWKDQWEKIEWEIKDYEEFRKDKKWQKAFNAGGEDLTPLVKAYMHNRINSWAVRFCYSMYKHGGLGVYPAKSKVAHIGNTPEATHVTKTKKLDVFIDETKDRVKFPEKIEINRTIAKEISDLMKPSPVRKIINYFRYDFLK